jgi:hypothetical protein
MSTSTARRIGLFGAPVVVAGAVAASVTLAGASTPTHPAAAQASTKQVGTLYARTELYFGSNRGVHKPVSPTQ